MSVWKRHWLPWFQDHLALTTTTSCSNSHQHFFCLLDPEIPAKMKDSIIFSPCCQAEEKKIMVLKIPKSVKSIFWGQKGEPDQHH